MNTQAKMGIKDVILFTISSIIVVDGMTASAKIGISSVVWWGLMFLFFVIPYGLIISELGTTYKGDGIIYDWVKKAFGAKWSRRVTWFYWVNVALWMPAVYIMFAGLFSQLFYPKMPLFVEIIMCIVLTWLTVWVCSISVSVAKWIPNIGAFAKVFILLVIGLAGIVYLWHHPSANTFNWSQAIPHFKTGMTFVPVIIFNLLGFELVASMGNELQNPNVAIPRAIFLSAIVVTGLYILTTLGILFIIPESSLTLVGGLAQTFFKVFGTHGIGEIIVFVLGLIALFSFFANMVTWVMGANRAAVQSAKDGELPKLFAQKSVKKQTPVGANIITGIISTIVVVLYGFFSMGANELFWTLFSFSTVIFLFPYVFMFPAFLKLRMVDTTTVRYFTVPGNMLFLTLLTVIPTIIVIVAIVLFIFPHIFEWQFDWIHVSLPILVGLVLTILVGEYLGISSGKTKGQPRND